MTTRMAAKAVPVKRDQRCGFCRTGHHDHCPRAVTNGVRKIWVCRCTEPTCQGGAILRCLDCKYEPEDQIAAADEISHVLWQCYDQAACQARREARTAANPTIQLIRQMEERAMPKARPQTGNVREMRPPRERKQGVCLVTGRPTSGGLFAPGMDARYVSLKVQEVLNGARVTEVRKQIKADGVSEKLTAKFEKNLALAQERAKAEKEAEKAKKTAAKKTASRPARIGSKTKTQSDGDGDGDDNEF